MNKAKQAQHRSLNVMPELTTPKARRELGFSRERLNYQLQKIELIIQPSRLLSSILRAKLAGLSPQDAIARA